MTQDVPEQSVKSNYHGVKVLTTALSSLCILTVAMTLGLGHLYMMAVALAAVPLVSYAVGKRMLAGLTVRRQAADTAWDGQPVPVTLRIENQSNLPRYFLHARDTLPEGAQFAESDGIIPLAVPARGTQESVYQVVFQHRGRYSIGPLDIQATDPLGMFFFSHRLRERSEIVVLPTPLSLPAIESFRGANYAAAGTHSAPVRGDSVEFLGIREYIAGDPLRRVDWKHSARYGELFVRDFERFTQTEVCVVLDTSPSLRQLPASFELMIKGVSGALHLAHHSGLPYRLLIGKPEVDGRPAQWSSDHLYHYLYALADIQPQTAVSFVDVVSKAIATAQPGGLLVLVTASADGRLLPLVQACTRRQIQVVALLPNVPALDKQGGVNDALHESDFLNALSAHGVMVVPLHPGGGS